jgi:uncharacterized membrane protein YdcZ (DUF606 family)
LRSLLSYDDNFDLSQIGTGLGFGLLIAGQLLLSVILEHFNFLVVEPIVPDAYA